MSDRTPEDKGLLERAPSGGLAKADDHGRVKRKLFMQLGFGTGVRTAATSAIVAARPGMSAGATTARAGGVLVGITKLTIAALVGAAIAICAIVVYVSNRKTSLPAASTSGQPPPPTLPSTPIEVPFPSLTSETEPASPATGPIAAPAPAASRSAALAHNRSAPVSERGVNDRAPSALLVPASTSVDLSVASNTSPLARRAPASTADTQVPEAPPPDPTTAAAEAELLRHADAARQAGDPSSALALLEEHRSRFANGMLVQEREAERVILLCALGRHDDARAAGYAFLRNWPRSPLASRVQGSCGGRLDARH